MANRPQTATEVLRDFCSAMNRLSTRPKSALTLEAVADLLNPIAEDARRVLLATPEQNREDCRSA